MGVVGQDRFRVADRPTGEPDVKRALVREDQLGESVAGHDRPADPLRPVDAVDGQRVVGHHRLERVGDQVEHAGRIQGGHQSLVHLEQSPLALEPVVQLSLLPMHLGEGIRVDHRLRGVAREDLEGPLIVFGVLVIAHPGEDDDPQHA